MWNPKLALLIAGVISLVVTYFTNDDMDMKIKAAFKNFGITIPVFTSRGIE